MAAMLLASVFLTACGGVTEDMLATRESAVAMMENGDYEGAVAAFNVLVEEATKVTEFELDVLKYRAEAEFMLEDYAAAVHTYRTLMEVDKELPEYYYCASIAMARDGQTEEASELLMRGKDLDKKLEAAGVVRCSRSQFYIIYSLNREIFDKPLYELIKMDTPVVSNEEKYQKEVLSHFFKYGRLTQLPTQRKKREIVLREIAKAFDADRTYEETEVNDIIHRFHEDHCTIRREMIAFGIMARERETYWKL